MNGGTKMGLRVQTASKAEVQQVGFPPTPPIEEEEPQGHSAAEGIKLMKNSGDTIGNQTRDIPACSAVPQPTAQPCAPEKPLIQFAFLTHLPSSMG
jgi:hypothetical protein